MVVAGQPLQPQAPAAGPAAGVAERALDRGGVLAAAVLDRHPEAAQRPASAGHPAAAGAYTNVPAPRMAGLR
jgi:hypothetical protein